MTSEFDVWMIPCMCMGWNAAGCTSKKKRNEKVSGLFGYGIDCEGFFLIFLLRVREEFVEFGGDGRS